MGLAWNTSLIPICRRVASRTDLSSAKDPVEFLSVSNQSSGEIRLLRPMVCVLLVAAVCLWVVAQLPL